MRAEFFSKENKTYDHRFFKNSTNDIKMENRKSDRNCIGIYICFLFISDWKTSEYEFANGEEFEVPWGRKGGIMHSSCNTPGVIQ